MCGGKNKKYRKVGNECRLTCCLIVKMVTVCQCSEGCPTIGYNGSGLEEVADLEALTVSIRQMYVNAVMFD